jgi:hypothetical protein
MIPDLLDGAASGFVGSRHHKIRKTASLDLGRALQAIENRNRQPGFQTGGGS